MALASLVWMLHTALRGVGLDHVDIAGSQLTTGTWSQENVSRELRWLFESVIYASRVCGRPDLGKT